MARILESKLYEAAEEGNVTAFIELIQQDHLLLDRVLVNYTAETPLHVAAMLGHTDFVKEIIQRKPEFTRESDSGGSTALHLASAKGYVEIVKALLFVNPDICLARDKEERNPLHIAAMKGQVDVLKELIHARPQAAQVTVAWGETILHLCVKHGQYESLKLLIEAMNDHEHEIVNAKDDYGMTILHLAVAYKQVEMVNFLLSNTSVEVNGLNANGFTARDVLAQSRRGLKDFDIAESLQEAGALRAADISYPGPGIGESRANATPLIAQIPTIPVPPRVYHRGQQTVKQEDWLTRKRDALMVVASLIATMAFQAGLTPPGGLWQDDSATGTSQSNNGTDSHNAGTSIMGDRNHSYFSQYLYCNTISFISSLSIILLLITGLPFKRRFFMWILTVTVWVAITSTALTYRISLLFLTPKTEELSVIRVLDYAVKAWSGVMALLLLGHTIRLAASLFNKVENVLAAKRRPPPPLAQTNISYF